MALPAQFARIPRLYHFTDRSNLPGIHQAGGLLATTHLNEMKIAFKPGGNPLSLGLDINKGMDRYVHLCFLPNQPMQFRAVEDGRITDNVWLRVNRSILDVPGVLFCGKVSNANEATPVPIEEAADLIDYGALYGYLDWRVPELQERRKTAELSEILVPDFISTVYLENLPNG